MSEKKPYIGSIKLGVNEIPCFVTHDGISLLSATKMQSVLGLIDEGKRHSGSRLKRFLEQKTLGPYFERYFEESQLQPVKYDGPNGKITGYKATILTSICKMMLEARRDGVLNGQRQQSIAMTCEILLGALADVGIEALVHEATGYQQVRERDALQKILDAYLSKELSAWAKRFPDEFYKEIFRLKGWPYNPMSVKRPSCVANYTTNVVYNRLAPGIVEELENKNPSNEKGARKHRHHQFLTDDVGHPALSQHIYGVIGLMRTQQTWEQFMRFLNRAYPVKTVGELFSDIE